MKKDEQEQATRFAIEGLESNRSRLRTGAMLQAIRSDIETNRIVPVVVRLLDDPDLQLRRSTTNVLRRFYPVAAAAVGIDTNPPPVVSGERRGRPGR